MGNVAWSAAVARAATRLTSRPADMVDRLVWSGQLATALGHYDDAVAAAVASAPLATTSYQRGEIALLELRARTARDGRVPSTLLATLSEPSAGHDSAHVAQAHVAAARLGADRLALPEARRHLDLAEAQLSKLGQRPRRTWSELSQLHSWVSVLSGDQMEPDAYGTSSPCGVDDAHVWIRQAAILSLVGRCDEARDMVEAVQEASWFAESLPVMAAAYEVSTRMELRAGRVTAALRAAHAWQRVMGGHRTDGGDVPFLLLRLYAWAGDGDAVRRAHSRAAQIAADRDEPYTWAIFAAESGAMHLHRHELDEAVTLLDRARAYAVGFDNPSLLGTEPDFVEACVRSGEQDRARMALADLDRRAERVPSAWAAHTVARCRALVADGDAAVKLFDAAMRTAGDVSPVELARTEFCRAEFLRRQGWRAEAAVVVRRATQLADECGAHGLVVAAGRARGGRIAGPGDGAMLEELTDAERLVARLVATGRRNREIAAELFVSVRTVESHLSRIFRKLGVRSRAELASVLAGEADGGPTAPR